LKIVEISAFADFQRALEDPKSHSYMWRGVSSADYPLIPKVAREWHQDLFTLNFSERAMLEQFRVRAMLYLKDRPANDWEWLALGQHYGLPTRLMDWSKNPLVALYFACTENFDKDGAVYFARRINEIDLLKQPDPFGISDTRAWHPLQIDQRMFFQQSLFTVSNNPLEPLKNDIQIKALIKKEAKETLIKTLKLFGIDFGTIFPGLEGAARHAETFFWFKGFKGDIITALKELDNEENS
jgi:type I restriction enzyme M protein